MSMYEGVPPEKHEQLDQFMVAHANTGRVLDALRDWIEEMPIRPDLTAGEIVAPSYDWLSQRTGLSDGMLATALLALFASGGVLPHPERADVWLLAGEGEIDAEAGRDRLFTMLDLITRSGHHINFQASRRHAVREPED